MNHHSDVGGAIKKAIRRTAFRQLTKGTTTTIPVASHRHTPEEVADNILAVVNQLKTSYPGGLANIRGLNIKVGVLGTSSLPLFVSMGQGPEVNPYVVGPREKKMLKLKRETKNVLSNFEFTNEGTIKKLTKEQIAKKKKIQEAKSMAAESDEVKVKKAKKNKKKKENKDVEAIVEKVVEKDDTIEELIRLEDDDNDSNDDDSVELINDDSVVELVNDGEDDDDDDSDE